MTMPRSHPPSRRVAVPSLVAVSIGAVLVVLGATGCTASIAPSEDGSSEQPAVVAETPAAESTIAEDEVTCAAFSDVQTVLHNAQAAFYDDRMSAQELGGWSALASRLLGTIPTAEEGRVAEALTAVKEAVPAVQSPLGPSNILSREWDAPGAELLAACEAAGFPVMTTGFVGG